MENNIVVEQLVEEQLNKPDDQLTEEQLKKIQELEKVQKSIDLRINENKRIENIVSASNTVTGKTRVVKNSYDGTLPQWFTLPPNATNATISICGGGGGGGGAPHDFWGVSGAGGAGGETIWQFPLNNGDTIYSVIGKGGNGGSGSLGTTTEYGANGGVTIVEGSANFPPGGLRAIGGNGGGGGGAYNRAYGGGWSGTSNPYSIGGQAGGHGGITVSGNRNYAQDGWPCYDVPGGIAGTAQDMGDLFLLRYGGGGGGASMFGTGGTGGHGNFVPPRGYNGIKGGGGGGAGVGSHIVEFEGKIGNGGKGGDGVVRVEYYV